jgi:tetratricopeptide (TPR) repeat protein
LASVGRLDASLIEARKAYEIDPQQAVLISRLAMAYFWLDDLDNAEFYFARSNAHKEYEASVHDLAYSMFLIRVGDFDRAISEASAGLEKAGLDSSWVPAVFEGMHNPAKYDEAHRIVEQLSAGEHLGANVEISLWALLQDGERAMSVARRLQDSGEVFEAELMFIPQFSVLREHPGFPGLLDAIGMTEYWASIGCAWQGDYVNCENEAASSGMH